MKDPVVKWILIIAPILAVIGIGLIIYHENNNPLDKWEEQQQAQKMAALLQQQPQRLEFINKLKAEGIIQKVEKLAQYPHVWVTPSFYTLDFEDKQSFIGVIYTYYLVRDSKSDMVILYDSKTGKEVGVYAELYGGLKMN